MSFLAFFELSLFREGKVNLLEGVRWQGGEILLLLLVIIAKKPKYGDVGIFLNVTD